MASRSVLIAATAAVVLLGCSTSVLAREGWHARCSACRAVAAELVVKLEAEQPRNHLDMRHRLDKARQLHAQPPAGRRCCAALLRRTPGRRMWHHTLLQRLLSAAAWHTANAPACPRDALAAAWCLARCRLQEGKRWGKVIDYKMSELRVIHLLDDLCDAMSKYELFDDGNGTQRWALSGSRFAGKNPSVEVTKQQRRELTNYCHDVLERHEDELSHALRNSLIDTDTASDFICLSTANHCNLSLAEEQAQEQAQAEEQAQEQAEEEQAEGAAAVDADGEAEAGEQPAEAAGTDGAVVDGSKEEL
ncbi:hypothetical protein CHLNCDRAFT_54952 [Chlorella variabilis]|uniref:DUF3456 domain-containing protein n=1 Tax=Chlorella variabilis TaxID=554065 RepID=E1ZR80_CHLVA|nr:hypothetical protein CHLNCDRAFT_54952 [Chlorella variabilis]EFN51732.1 hypothetical protein CHLNCDRAFT_54952 [Chlorella variabilis]|eukprot:XP_005843834.1 hypothetical protein CHLNCDRAFT_54952 [Chlorella variabilis]